MTTKSKVKIVLIAVLIAAIAYCSWAGVGAIALPQKASAATFDHSQCQYPTRTTNPPEGCDNSDPCDPASAAKGGSGDCAPVSDKNPNDLPDPNRPYYDGLGNKYDYMGNLIEAAPTEAAPAPASQCSGK